MEEPDVNTYLLKENLFELFREQLKKDFESAGAVLNAAVIVPSEFDALKSVFTEQLQPLISGNGTLLSSLLYRVDISELQLQKYRQKHLHLSFDEMLSELIIKRVLQKVILRKTFSK